MFKAGAARSGPAGEVAVLPGGGAAGASLQRPFVSVITPFYNSADSLERCIKSVLAQTHTDFEYVLSDNASTDGSGDIARAYAADDPRVRYVHWDELIPQSQNYNRALRLMSPRAAYCKIVQADDYIFPVCLERMLEVAVRHPSAGVIGGVRVIEGVQDPPEAERPQLFTPGKAICRNVLRHPVFPFGSPTSVMYRADLVRAREEFFNIRAFFDDNDAAFDLLQVSDFGFCPTLVTATTRDPDSTFGRVLSYDCGELYRYMTAHRIGERYFEPAELAALKRDLSRQYYEKLATAVRRRADRGAYLAFHRSVLQNTAGMRISKFKALTAGLGLAWRRLAKEGARLLGLRGDRTRAAA